VVLNTPWIVLDNAICFRVSGKDARRYLHNRLSQDIRALVSGHSARAAALSAQGRVEGVFAVICESDDRFLLVCDGGDRALVEAALKRFIVADRVVCDDLSSQVCLAHVAAEDSVVAQTLEQTGLQSLCRFSRRRVGAEGVDIVIASGDKDQVSSKLMERLGDVLSRERYDYLRWEASCPVFPEEINDQGMVLEFGLRDAVSFTKGCYVGQEVVERSDAIGRVPRTLARITLQGSGAVALGEPVTNPAAASLGKVVGAVRLSGADTVYLFALLSAGKYKEGDEVVCAGRSGTIVG
jgi:folate-binding protein YgfZ